MKKIVSLFLAVILILSFPLSSFAATSKSTRKIITNKSGFNITCDKFYDAYEEAFQLSIEHIMDGKSIPITVNEDEDSVRHFGIPVLTDGTVSVNVYKGDKAATSSDYIDNVMLIMFAESEDDVALFAFAVKTLIYILDASYDFDDVDDISTEVFGAMNDEDGFVEGNFKFESYYAPEVGMVGLSITEA